SAETCPFVVDCNWPSIQVHQTALLSLCGQVIQRVDRRAEEVIPARRDDPTLQQLDVASRCARDVELSWAVALGDDWVLTGRRVIGLQGRREVRVIYP